MTTFVRPDAASSVNEDTAAEAKEYLRNRLKEVRRRSKRFTSWDVHAVHSLLLWTAELERRLERE
ncbi:MAG: hypothetical protein OCU12_06350 [Methanophagales archaeon]|nr:hypothetical protein [Methanophagales archaeon]